MMHDCKRCSRKLTEQEVLSCEHCSHLNPTPHPVPRGTTTSPVISGPQTPIRRRTSDLRIFVRVVVVLMALLVLGFMAILVWFMYSGAGAVGALNTP